MTTTNPTTNETPLYDVAQLGKLESHIARINRRAAKLGLPAVKLTVVSSYWKEEKAELSGIVIRAYRRHIVKIDGETVRIAGYTLAAVIQHTTKGNIIRRFPGFDLDIPALYRDAKPICEHCNKARGRGETFLLYDGQGGFKQVGRNCLADFTGAHNPEYYASVAQFLSSVHINGGDFDDLMNVKPAYPIRFYLIQVCAEIRENGWLSRSAAKDDYFRSSTADLALNAMLNRVVRVEKGATPRDCDFELADKVIAWGRGELNAKENKNDFEHNLAVALQDDYVDFENIGIIAAAVPAYGKALEVKAKVADYTNSQYVGVVGKRQEFHNLTVVKVIHLQGDYGLTFLIKLVDENNNLLVWFSSSVELTEGSTYSGKATIKAHNQRDGINQTIITRAALS